MGYTAWRLGILWLKMCMAWPSGRMRSLPVSPRNSSARGKGFSFLCSSPLKSTQREGEDKKTCRSCNIMYPRITINPYRAKEPAAGRLIPLREARHGTARPAPTPFSGGAALTHMFGDLSSRVTRADDPRPRARPAAPLPAPRPAAPRSPTTPRETEVGKGRTQLMALHGQQGGRLRGATCRGLPCGYPGGGRGCPSILWRRPRQRLTHGAGSDAAHYSGGAPGRGGSLSSE